MGSNYPIDIVLPWVDGNDTEWQSRYMQYKASSDGDSRNIRFRDWGLLKYWFRSIENFAPWIRKVHFVTSGELPDWLDLNNPKLNWVKHKDFIPHEYLPTFNINAIETNIHRIEGLSDHFIYFNDDLFLTKEVIESDFFRDGMPCDCAILDPIFPERCPSIFVNSTIFLNNHFCKKEVLKKHFTKWINLRYGKNLLKSLLLMPWEKFPGILNPHLTQPFRKDSFVEVWNIENEKLHNTGLNKFRTHLDLNQWTFRYWRLAKGEFLPYNKTQQGVCLDISNSSIDEICKIIRTQKYKEICINDDEDITNFEELRSKIDKAFNHILPNKSSFEKQ